MKSLLIALFMLTTFTVAQAQEVEVLDTGTVGSRLRTVSKSGNELPAPVRNRKFNSLRVQALDDSFHIASLRVTFGNGETLQVAAGQTIREGGTRTFPFNMNPRNIRSITVTGSKALFWSSDARLKVFVSKVNWRPSPRPQPAPRPQPQPRPSQPERQVLMDLQYQPGKLTAHTVTAKELGATGPHLRMSSVRVRIATGGRRYGTFADYRMKLLVINVADGTPEGKDLVYEGGFISNGSPFVVDLPGGSRRVRSILVVGKTARGSNQRADIKVVGQILR